MLLRQNAFNQLREQLLELSGSQLFVALTVFRILSQYGVTEEFQPLFTPLIPILHLIIRYCMKFHVSQGNSTNPTDFTHDVLYCSLQILLNLTHTNDLMVPVGLRRVLQLQTLLSYHVYDTLVLFIHHPSYSNDCISTQFAVASLCYSVLIATEQNVFLDILMIHSCISLVRQML